MDDIAIVGLSFRLPQEAKDEASFWEVLEKRKNLMTEWPESRLKLDAFYDRGPGGRNKLKSRGAHFLKQDPAAFDAPFFSITANEAAAMDPQHRLALETAYHAFENAGMPVATLRGSRTSVYAASFTDDYSRMLVKDPDQYPRTTILGTAPSILSNRLSWYFDLSGPSVHVDTACSSSLVALDLACQSLRNGDASMAMVLGTNMILSPEASVLLSNGDFLSPDSVCYSFDHRANGYARGEGIISLIIKPVSDAVRDGDMIRAVIRSIGSNQDGRTPVISQPSSRRQEDLIRHVYRKAGLEFGPVRYVEAHGTGTRVGDPAEMEALGRVFAAHRSASEPLYVGSVKANIGHLEGSAGLAGVLKAMLVLERAVIPPTALFERLNPDIDADLHHVAVPTTSIPWPSQGLRRVSVNSFGFGGTNSHVVMDDAFHHLQACCLKGIHRTISRPPFPLNGNCTMNGHGTNAKPINGTPLPCSSLNGGIGVDPSTRRLLVFSAPDEKALKRVIQTYKPYYEGQIRGNDSSLAQLALTLAARRSLHLWRTYAVVDSVAIGETSGAELAVAQYSRASKDRHVAFIFTGQGAQYAGMGLALVRYAVFRQTLEEADKALCQLGCTWSVVEMLRSDCNIHKPEYSQPLCTALQIALVELLKSFGVVPCAVVGHSSGEIAAAYAAGALSLASACKVAYFRGRLAGQLGENAPTSSMMSVNLAADRLPRYLKEIASEWADSVTVACMNSPVNSTLSGPSEAIDTIQHRLSQDGIFAKKLSTGVAYHSPYMDAIAVEYAKKLGHLEASETKVANINTVTVVSTVTGQLVTREVLATAHYWVDNLVSPVRFSEALLAMVGGSLKSGSNISDLIEVGPHHALRRPVQDTLMAGASSSTREEITYHSALQKPKDATSAIMELAGQLFCRGYPLSVQTVNQQQPLLGCDNAVPFRVDCPPYPFEHSHKYWAEPRLSRDFRLREPVPRSSLGARYQHWNPLEPTWRQLLCVEAMPWTKDHEVTGRILFPGAGMIVMALEAAKQMCPENRNLSGLYIKESHFLNPIMLAETWEQSTEALIQLRPVRKAYEKQTVWFNVRITTQADGRWNECFSASIRTEFEDEVKTQVDGGTERRLGREALVRKAQLADEACTHSLDRHAFYRCCHEAGLHYGESFQLLEAIRWDGKDTATARIDLASAKHHGFDSLVHPAVLDCALQLTGAQVSSGLSKAMPAFVPSQLCDAWFFPQEWRGKSPNTSQLSCLATQSAPPDARGTMSMAIHVFADDNSPLCVINRLTMARVAATSEVDGPNGSDGPKTKLLHGIRWNPQLSLLGPENLRLACDAETGKPDDGHMEAYRHILDMTLNDVLCDTVKSLSRADPQQVPKFLAPYVSWMKQHVEKRQAVVRQNCGGPGSEMKDLKARLETIGDMHPPWQIFPVVAQNLEGILLGRVDPLEVAFNTQLAERFYVDLFEQTCDERFHRLLNLMAHENPCMRILEVGAGTGGFTGHILNSLGNERDTCVKFAQYTYTDVSPAFFEAARTRLNHFAGRMRFKTLDLECDAIGQGFEEAGYDVVFAGSVLHATADLSATLQNIRRLLKPGGRLVLLEAVAPESVVTNFAFGLLPGWWRCIEPCRKLSPAITEEQWDDVLRHNGFSGNDLTIKDHASDTCHIASILASTVSSIAGSTEGVAAQSKRLFVVFTGNSDLDDRGMPLDSVQAALPAWDVQAWSLDEFSHTPIGGDDVVVSLVEARSPFLSNMTESDFQMLKNLIKRTCKLLWVTKAGITSNHFPHNKLMEGFLRSMRSENVDKQIVSLSIESDSPDDDCAQYVLQVLEAAFISASPSPELEYRAIDGQLTTARAFQDELLNSHVHSLAWAEQQSQEWQHLPAVKLSVGRPGFINTLEFIKDQSYEIELGPNEIEIKAKAWGLSFRDVFVGLDRLAGDGDLGFDCAGVVTRIGRDCDGTIQPGDRVCGVSLGCMRAFPRAPSSNVAKIPPTVSLEAAASLIMPGSTAYYSLVHVGRLQRGEKVLIHSASGSTGQMAVWVAKSVGAEIFATVGYDDKKQLLIDKFGLQADHIFYSRNTSFAQGVMRMTQGYGVDVVLNSLAGDGLRASWECVASYGRFVEIGKADVMSNTGLPMAGFARNVSFTAVDLHHMAQSNPYLTGRLTRETMDLVISGAIEYPSPLHVYPVSEVERAFRYLQSGKSTGRIVININDTDVVPTRICKTTRWVFDSSASYMVAGGLGGLGRAISDWMVTKGARNLILPSRSGLRDGSPAARTVQKLQQSGVKVLTPKCDLSVAAEVADLLHDCAVAGMPPIKGCINAAMVLQDAVFDNMTHAQWDLTVRSKAQSAWNLHQALPADLDFFILLSSLAGINGSVAQSNYAAGCTFQDALARFRMACGRGRRSISLDLGWIRNIGIIAETPAYQHVRETAADMAQIEDQELLAVLDLCCDLEGPLTAAGQEDITQLLVGVVTPSDRLAEGKPPPPLTQRPLFAGFSLVAGGRPGDGGSSGAEGAGNSTTNYAAMFRQAIKEQQSSSTGDVAVAEESPSRIVVRALTARLGRALDIAAEDVEPAKKLDDYGVDSLIAVELRNWLAKDFGATLAVFEIMGGTSIAAIGDLVVEKTDVGKRK